MYNFNQYTKQIPPNLNKLYIKFIHLNNKNKNTHQHIYKSNKNFKTLIKIT